MTSKILELHDYLVLIGQITEPYFATTEDRDAVALLEAEGLLESPEQVMSYLGAGQNPVTASDWIREPVPMREWLNDGYYSGDYAGAMYEKLQEDMVEIFDPKRDPQIIEVIATGAIGWGKSMAAGLCMAREIYEISCLKEPHKLFGIAPGTDIVLLNLSVTGEQAENAIYKYVFNTIDRAGYFKEHYPRDKKIDSEIRFKVKHSGMEEARDTGLVYRPGNSRETSTIGLNVISGAIDEANFMVSSSRSAHEKLQGNVEHALVLYRAMVRRIESRFKFSRGFKGRLFLCSSKMYQGDFLDQHIAECRGDPTVKVMDYSHWAVRPKSQFCGKTFRVVIGAAGVRSRILRDQDRVKDGARVIDVPVEYEIQFKKDLEGCVRDIAGESTLAMRPMMDPAAVMRQQVSVYDDMPLVHPFEDDTTGLYSDQIKLVLPAICDQVEVIEGGKKVKIWRPKRKPEASRFIHVDLALKNDACVTGDTLVATPSGNKRIVDLVGSKTPVYCYSQSTGRMKVSTAYNIGLRKKMSPILEVETDGGSIRCTPDHLWMLRDGSYRRADQLRIGDSLMPFYRSETRGHYESVYSPGSGACVLAHKIVGEWMVGRALAKNECVHHRGFHRGILNRLDNAPENLQVMDKLAHHKLHADILTRYNKSEKHRKEAGAIGRAALKRLWADPAWRAWKNELSSRQMSKRNRKNNPARLQHVRAQKSERLKQTHAEGKLKDNWKRLQRSEVREKQISAVARANAKRVWTPEMREKCSAARVAYWEQVRAGKIVRNHKVISVRSVGHADTYCMNVEADENFVAVFDDGRFSSGVVLHNCGFVMGYIAGEMEVTKWDKDTESMESMERELVPILVYELLGSFVAPVGDEIRGSQIRSLIYQLRDLGFYIASVTFDQFQSADSRQILGEHGFTVDEVSVDRDANAYEILRDGLRDGWIYYYPHKTAERELLKVERVYSRTKKVKVDHPERDMDNKRTGLGSKDVADGMAAVAWYVLQHYTSVSSLIAPSAGYVEGEGKQQILRSGNEGNEARDEEENWVVGPRL